MIRTTGRRQKFSEINIYGKFFDVQDKDLVDLLF